MWLSTEVRFGGTTREDLTEIQKMAQLTRSIYTPDAEDLVEENSADLDFVRLGSLLKRNRVLYHVLKETNYPIADTDAKSRGLREFLRRGNDHFVRMHRSLKELNQLLGRQNYMVFKTDYGYPRLTTDIDVLVHDLSTANRMLSEHGWKAGEIQQGTVDLEKDGYIPVGLHQKIAWETPPILDEALLWKNCRGRGIAGVDVIIPSPEVDILTILAHIPFEKLYFDWGEMCYLYRTAKEADLDIVLEQATRHHWGHTFRKLLRILNSFHYIVFGKESPFELVCPRRASIDEPTLPYEWPFLFAGLSLVEIGAWKKILDVLSDVNRVRHFFNGRSERKKISL